MDANINNCKKYLKETKSMYPRTCRICGLSGRCIYKPDETETLQNVYELLDKQSYADRIEFASKMYDVGFRIIDVEESTVSDLAEYIDEFINNYTRSK